MFGYGDHRSFDRLHVWPDGGHTNPRLVFVWRDVVLLVGEFGVAWWAESQPNPVTANALPQMRARTKIWHHEQRVVCLRHHGHFVRRVQRDADSFQRWQGSCRSGI